MLELNLLSYNGSFGSTVAVHWTAQIGQKQPFASEPKADVRWLKHAWGVDKLQFTHTLIHH